MFGAARQVPDQRLLARVAADHRPGRTGDTLGGSPGTCQRQPPQTSNRALPSRLVTDQLTQVPPPPSTSGHEKVGMRDGVLGPMRQALPSFSTACLPSKELHGDARQKTESTAHVSPEEQTSRQL